MTKIQALTAAIILLAAAGAGAQTRTVVCNSDGTRCWTERPAPRLERRQRTVVYERYERRVVRPLRPYVYPPRYPYPYPRPVPRVYTPPVVYPPALYDPPIYVPPRVYTPPVVLPPPPPCGAVINDFRRRGGGTTIVIPLC